LDKSIVENASQLEAVLSGEHNGETVAMVNPIREELFKLLDERYGDGAWPANIETLLQTAKSVVASEETPLSFIQRKGFPKARIVRHGETSTMHKGGAFVGDR
jgi:hypothetical protein